MRFLLGIIVGILGVAVIAALVAFTGAYNVAASVPPSKLETRAANWALDRAVARRAPDTKNPLSAKPEVLRSGLSHFRENCVACHGAPGVDAAEFGQGLNPPAPDLTLPRVQRRPDGELFWITSHGIRLTGMPAFSPTHEPEEIWQIVAFLRHLPELTADEEKELRAATEEAEHHHDEVKESKKPPGHEHAPGTPPHRD
jgi:mono/diheme cytochrome c family protein